jgi:hypothetical protein
MLGSNKEIIPILVGYVTTSESQIAIQIGLTSFHFIIFIKLHLVFLFQAFSLVYTIQILLFQA